MSRARPILLNALTMLWLAAALAVVYAWVESYAGERVEWVFAESHARWPPVGVRGRLEFGALLGSQAVGPTSQPAAFEWRDRTFHIAPHETALVPPRRVAWSVLGVERREGRLIPADGWETLAQGDFIRWRVLTLTDYRVWSVPYAWPLVGLLAWPAARLAVGVRRFVKARGRAARRAGGRCPACGYDLRATPGRCPECGGADGPG